MLWSSFGEFGVTFCAYFFGSNVIAVMGFCKYASFQRLIVHFRIHFQDNTARLQGIHCITFNTTPIGQKTFLIHMSKMLQICTHSGSFHADEALAVYMLRLLPKWKDAKLVRSRNSDDWEASDVVMDVSGKYDGVKYFDHHQREFNTTFNDKYATKLSSAGLIYKHFGKDILTHICEYTSSDAEKLDFLYDKVYADFIEAVDANDNGINKFPEQDSLIPRFRDRNFSIAGMVSNLNPSWDQDPTDADYDAQFLKASALIGQAFYNYATYIGKSFLKAKQYVIDAVDAKTEDKIIEFSTFVPWKEHLFTVEKERGIEGDILYAIFPDSSGSWRIAAVPVSSSSFDSRKKLPEPWRGLRDDELSAATGVPGCVFIHAAGFIGGAKTREGALQLAKMAVKF